MGLLNRIFRHEMPATTLIQAQDILGAERVFDNLKVEEVWGESRLRNPTIPYDIATLKAKAKENRKKSRCWMLVYVIGLSLEKQQTKRGFNSSDEPCFMQTGIWSDPDYDSFIKESGSSGYRLLDFSVPFRNLSFDEQSAKIGKNSKYQRVSARTVSEAALSVLMISGSCPLLSVHHTANLTQDGDVLRLILFQKTLVIFTCPDFPREDSGAIICQLYDIAPRK